MMMELRNFEFSFSFAATKAATLASHFAFPLLPRGQTTEIS